MKIKQSISKMLVFSVLAMVVTTSFLLSNSVNATVEQDDEENSTAATIMGNNIIPIGTSGDNVYIVWESDVNGVSEILFTKHTPDGFLGKINLSNSPDTSSENPNIQVDGSNIHVTWWEKSNDGSIVPVYRASSDNGSSFGGVTALSQIFTR